MKKTINSMANIVSYFEPRIYDINKIQREFDELIKLEYIHDYQMKIHSNSIINSEINYRVLPKVTNNVGSTITLGMMIESIFQLSKIETNE